MKTVHISVSREYDVHIGEGLLSSAGELFKTGVGEGCSVAIAAGEHVNALYGERLGAALGAAGYKVHYFTYPGGEGYKTLATYEKLLAFLSERHFCRSDVVAALGGGTTGDLAGFAAATYQRGIGFVQVPTTLLAAVDSSVGGKTALNLPTGKNQVGCFYQPRLVLCDTATLSTLTATEIKSGMGEIVKYAMLSGEGLFEALEREGEACVNENTVGECVKIKSAYVAEDEFDTGRRMLLNLGHTIGHAIEKCSAYTVPHGYAVSAGAAMITRAASVRGICADGVSHRLDALLTALGLPTGSDYAAEELYNAALSDKKLNGGKLKLIVPEKIGQCRIEPIAPEELLKWLKAGGAK